MQDYIYSVISFLAMAIHLIINSGMIADRGIVNARGACTYRRFLWGVFAYYIVDAGWGVLAGLGWTNALYVDTALYYIAIAVSVLTWCHFVIVYLDLGKWTARTLSWFGYALLSLYIVLLTVNVFNNCLFYFDDQGNYIAGPIRLMLFYPLVALNVPLAIFAFLRTLRSMGHPRRRHLVVFLFCLTMMAAVTLQIVWPLWPYYALGCLLGTCFLHIFLVEDERSDMRRAAIEYEQTVKHMAELEKALKRARTAEKSKSMFFSIVSHDIRTPLNAILGYSELLQNGIESESERSEALKAIRASGTTLLQLVNDVLDLAKLDAGKMTLRPVPLLLTQLIDDVLSSFRMAAKNKGVELVNRTADMPTLLLDGHRFRQILFNLVGNAVKFTERGSVTVAASYDGTNLTVSVSDTGCGIPSDMLPRILDPFVQVQEAQHSADRAIGTGLGLSICRSLVEIMGGELFVESELGKGSTFKVCVPGVAASGEKARPEVASKRPLGPKNLPKHVLIVDDSPVNRSVLTAFTKRAGIDSIGHACDGVEALSELESAAKSDSPYDFVVSDFWMPNMNGLEFVEKLRADSRFGNLPVFALTADTEIRGDSRTRLFTGVLLKPLTYDKLVEAFAAVE
jgi:signal transduction histidine kinase